MVSEIATLLVHGEDELFFVAFMFSPIYLRLEGNVPPEIENFFKHEYNRFLRILVMCNLKMKCLFMIMLNFWWLDEQSKWQSCWKCKKMATKMSKIEMLIFGL